MLRELAKLLGKGEFLCQVSMEERMACGLGACPGVRAFVRGRDGEITYQRVCKEGPIFNMGDVIW